MSDSREDEPGSRDDRDSRRDNGQQQRRQGGKQGGKSYDPVADLQGWLIRQGAKSMASQVADNVRRTIGQQERRRDKGDVWETATTEPPPDEAPECQWCPVCQAARRLRESGPGLGAKIADAGGVFASVMQDAFAAVEQVMKVPETKPRPDRPDRADRPDRPERPDAGPRRPEALHPEARHPGAPAPRQEE